MAAGSAEHTAGRYYNVCRARLQLAWPRRNVTGLPGGTQNAARSPASGVA